MLLTVLDGVFQTYVFFHLDYPSFSGCRFRVPASQRRAAGGGFAAKVSCLSLLGLMSVLF